MPSAAQPARLMISIPPASGSRDAILRSAGRDRSRPTIRPITAYVAFSSTAGTWAPGNTPHQDIPAAISSGSTSVDELKVSRRARPSPTARATAGEQHVGPQRALGRRGHAERSLRMTQERCNEGNGDDHDQDAQVLHRSNDR